MSTADRATADEHGGREKYRILFEQSRDAVFVTTTEGRILEANPAAVALFKIDPHSLDTYDATLFYAVPEERTRFRAAMDGQDGVTDFELVMRDQQGRRFPALVSASVWRDVDGVVLGYHGTIRDVTAIRAAEANLEVTSARLQAILDTITDAVVLVDAHGDIEFANPAAEAVLGVTPSEATERRFDDPAWRITDLNGGPVPTEELPFVRVMTTGQPVRDVRHAIERSDGTRVVLSVNAAPFRDSAGRPAGMVASVQDVTQRVRAEQEILTLNRELESRVEERTAQLAAINRELEAFAYSVSHDLRAPLRALDGFSQALVEDYGERLDGEALDFLQRIRKNSQRMGCLIDDILELSRVSRRELRRGRVDLVALANEALADLREAEPHREVGFHAPERLVAEGDPPLLRQLVQNLVGNAWKFTRDARGAGIELGVEERDGTRTYFVRDNGVGFDTRYADKLFKPFSRLHSEAEFEGTGIGLATVHRIVQRHGGTVAATGEVGQGATIRFTLGE